MLFEVRTKSFKPYYAEANGYDEAVRKVERAIANERELKGILDTDGSLAREEDYEIREVRLLTEDIIR